MIRRIALTLVGLVLLLVAGAYLLPRIVHVERTAHVDAPPEVVFAHVNSFQRWSAWSPWERRDPTMMKTLSGPTAGEGATQTWTSEADAGGTQTIIRSVPHKRIETTIDFGAQGTAASTWTFEADGLGTRVTWVLDADMGSSPVGRYLGLMMDRWVGPDFDDGLAALKQVVEQEASMAVSPGAS